MNKTLWLASTSTFLLGIIPGLVIGPLVHKKVQETQFTPMAKAENATSRLLLGSTQGVCTGEAKEARYEAKKGSGEVSVGCWVPLPNHGIVQITYFDGDIGQVPMALFEKVEK